MPVDETGAQGHTDVRAMVIRVTCPQCGHPLDVVPISAAPPPSAPQPTPTSPAVWAGRTMLTGLIHRFFPASSLADQAPATVTPIEQERAISPSRRRWLLLGVVLLMAAVVAALILWGHWGTAAAPATGNAPATAPVTHPTDTASQEAAIRETLARYNAAETEAAALLRIDPLTPYLAPDGPFAARRAAEIAERLRQHAPHRSILLRWGIGTITVSGDTATAVTQETWSNQEADAVAAEQATVRVTYTLRWNAGAERWLIVDTSQMPL